MSKAGTFRRKLRRTLYFFPFQLLVLHFKKNHLLLLCWLILFGYVTRVFSLKYGIPYLILYPEYFGAVGFWSFAITGFALGGFITAFNLYSYALHAFRFPFIATLARPFLKFSINNGVIPVVFVATYLFNSIDHQFNKELVPTGQIILNVAGLIFGISLFLFIAFLYFTRTNTDVDKILGADHRKEAVEDDEDDAPEEVEVKIAGKWFRPHSGERKWHVETYLAQPFRVALARSSSHYDQEMLRSVLWQNHINGSIFEVVLVISFLALGAFSDAAFFKIPAGASVFLLFTMMFMIISALFSWLKGWTLSLMIVVLVFVNLLSKYDTGLFYESRAYGMDYEVEEADYSLERMQALAYDTETYDADRAAFEQLLERWKKVNQAKPGAGVRPPMVFISTSGGGSRAMLWTYRSLQYADSLLDGDLMSRAALLTGSSGGLIGAAYYRQLYYNALQNDSIDLQDRSHLTKMSSDILNPVAFSLVTNDLFIRYRDVVDGNYTYTKDRGYAFEEQLNSNLDHVLDIRLKDMQAAEASAKVPVLIISPTVINDGRRLLISAQPISFLANNRSSGHVINDPVPENIEFTRFFAAQDPMNLKLTTALRMSATFPYITPVISMPSEPTMQVMDAGIRDNFGLRTSLLMIYEFKDWLKENTSGVVVLRIRDTPKAREVKPVDGSLVDRIFNPVGSVYDNLITVQDHEHDQVLERASTWLDLPIDIIDLELRPPDNEKISLSWHLTALEKKQVLQTIYSQPAQEAFRHMRAVLGTQRSVVDNSVSAVTAGGIAQ